jgi:protein phosphatase
MEGIGVVYTRTGRRFFADPSMEEGLLSGLRTAIDAVGLWAKLKTDWLALDAEVLPWSLKAEELLRNQYAAVGAAAMAGLGAATADLEAAANRGVDVGDILERQVERRAMAEAFVEAYGPYCWEVGSLADVRLAPFQILAGETGTFFDREHSWHMAVADRLAVIAPDLIRPTRNLAVDLADPEAREEGVNWWTALTADGGEGMVVKPPSPVSRGGRGYQSAGDQGARAGVPAHDLRSRIHVPREPGTSPRSEPRSEAVARTSRVRAGRGGVGALRRR